MVSFPVMIRYRVVIPSTWLNSLFPFFSVYKYVYIHIYIYSYIYIYIEREKERGREREEENINPS